MKINKILQISLRIIFILEILIVLNFIWWGVNDFKMKIFMTNSLSLFINFFVNIIRRIYL